VTKAEWLTSANPEKMLQLLAGKASERKLRLFDVVSCRSVVLRLPGNQDTMESLAVAERMADEHVDPMVIEQARESATATMTTMFYLFHPEYNPGAAASLVAEDAVIAAWWAALSPDARSALEQGQSHPDLSTPHCVAARNRENLAQIGFLRDIFGNPFRPATLDPAWLRWNDGAIPRIAQAIYDDRRFADLPVLADALEEAGCTSADILDHCRQGGEHVRGCWVVDLLLGKS